MNIHKHRLRSLTVPLAVMAVLATSACAATNGSPDPEGPSSAAFQPEAASIVVSSGPGGGERRPGKANG